MRVVRSLFCGVVTGVVALVSTTTSCSTHTSTAARQAEPALSEPTAPLATPAAAPLAQPPLTREEQTHELLQMAEVQIRDLQDSRAAATDPSRVATIDHQIATVSRYRDSVLADLGGQQPSPRLDADISNLQRAMQTAALTAPQAPLSTPVAPRIEVRPLQKPGGYIAYPPIR
jgi:hypothetical protein